MNPKPSPKPPRSIGGPLCEHRREYPCPTCEWGGWWYRIVNWLRGAI